ncbi:MAG TPA: hypothetical protein VMS71_07590, partial [Candidatus Acidoferrum sp.]|nr:hypothetical protein [Candidatus Acidoferrum sp.]
FVSRVLVVETSREGIAVTTHSHPSPQLRLAGSGQDEAESLPESVIGSLCRGEDYHVKDIADGVLNSEQAKARYLHNVKSESYFPIRGKRGLIGFLAVGTSRTGEYLARRAQLFQAVADFLALYFSLARRLANTEVPVQGGAPRSPDSSASSRLTTLRKLSDGCLHDMNGALSVVFGHAELLRSVGEEACAGTRSTSASLDKIVRAAETVSDRLTALRRVFACARYGSDSPIDSAPFLRDLPLMLSGLARQIRDTKNIDIALAVSLRDSRQDPLTASALYDVLLPTVIALMEEAVCSGQIKIALEQDDSSRLVSIEFSKNLLGALDPGELLGSISTRAVCTPEGDLSGSVTIEQVAVTYAPISPDRIRIAMGRSQAIPTSSDTSASHSTTERPE